MHPIPAVQQFSKVRTWVLKGRFEKGKRNWLETIAHLETPL